LQMFSRRNLRLVSFASAMVLSSIANAATKNLPSRLAQMTPSVCWQACSSTCDQTYEKCVADNTGQLTQCRTARDTCHDHCSDQCNLKK
jgi:hypothetical protein